MGSSTDWIVGPDIILSLRDATVPYLYRPTLTHRMSLKWGFFPARQSLQNQLPLGMSMFRHSRWKAAGQDSQHSRLPPACGAQFRKEQLFNHCQPPQVNMIQSIQHSSIHIASMLYKLIADFVCATCK